MQQGIGGFWCSIIEHNIGILHRFMCYTAFSAYIYNKTHAADPPYIFTSYIHTRYILCKCIFRMFIILCSRCRRRHNNNIICVGIPGKREYSLVCKILMAKGAHYAQLYYITRTHYT